MSEYGHNSGETAPQSLTQASKEKLRQFVKRLESLEEEISDRRGDLKDVYKEAKSLGYDTQTLRSIISIRKKDAGKLAEAEMMLDLYLEALGDI
jgi:uncharacterized protein (UPF0335 family)